MAKVVLDQNETFVKYYLENDLKESVDYAALVALFEYIHEVVDGTFKVTNYRNHLKLSPFIIN